MQSVQVVWWWAKKTGRVQKGKKYKRNAAARLKTMPKIATMAISLTIQTHLLPSSLQRSFLDGN
jgi:hypothetical protein